MTRSDRFIVHNKNHLGAVKECERSRRTRQSRLHMLIGQRVTEVIVHARPNITSHFTHKAKVIKMATGRDVPGLGGYDFEFTSKVPEDWQCLVCQLTLKDSVQIVGCGHRLCSMCMESLLRETD